MLLQQRLVCYSSESSKLPMTYRSVIDNGTMIEVSRREKAVMMIMTRGIPSSLRGSVKFLSQIMCELMSY
jgi:nitroimidazol reductase NimA-like FMN-containing flavoprotein (pyridoxamine 5'-phosphate oxidase superfamily)